MANKKKNSNYVTEKTTQKKADEAKKKQALKVKRTVKSVLIGVAIAAVAIAAVLALLYFCGVFTYTPTATEHVSIEFEGYNTSLHVELYRNDAPETVKGFLSRVNGKHFDGKTIHALIDGSLHLGDLDSGVESGGVRGEFSANGVTNNIPFEVGTLVMARGEDYDSGYGRFFIVTEDTDVNALKGNYAPFGKITGGMSVIDEIISGLTPNDDGTIPESERVVIKSISTHEH